MAKPRCPAKVSDDGKECRKLAHPIVGKCDDCGKLFCSAHRFMEEHNCEMQALVSPNPYSGDDDDPFRNVQWWMVGLDDLLLDCCGEDGKALADMYPPRQNRSSSRTTPSNSSRSVRRSSGYRRTRFGSNESHNIKQRRVYTPSEPCESHNI